MDNDRPTVLDVIGKNRARLEELADGCGPVALAAEKVLEAYDRAADNGGGDDA